MKIRCPKCGAIIRINAIPERDPISWYYSADFSHSVSCKFCNTEIRGARLQIGPDGIFDVINPELLVRLRRQNPPLPNISIQDRTPKNMDRLLQHINLPPVDPLDQLKKNAENIRQENAPQCYLDCLQAGFTHEQIQALINLIQSITA